MLGDGETGRQPAEEAAAGTRPLTHLELVEEKAQLHGRLSLLVERLQRQDALHPHARVLQRRHGRRQPARAASHTRSTGTPLPRPRRPALSRQQSRRDTRVCSPPGPDTRPLRSARCGRNRHPRTSGRGCTSRCGLQRRDSVVRQVRKVGRSHRTGSSRGEGMRTRTHRRGHGGTREGTVHMPRREATGGSCLGHAWTCLEVTLLASALPGSLPPSTPD